MLKRTILAVAFFTFLLTTSAFARTWVVNNGRADWCDAGEGTEAAPFRTISKAALVAMPGDTILVRAGVYRERVSPERGGEEGKPITYLAPPGEEVYVKGSEEFRPAWQALPDSPEVYTAALEAGLFGDFNPFHLDVNYAREPESRVMVPRRNRPSQEAASLPLTRGQVFVDGIPLAQTGSLEELKRVAGTWMVDATGETLFVHFPPDRRKRAPSQRLVEVTTRMRVFAPKSRGLGHITVKGFVFEHAANNHPTPQVGAVSTRSGHHWVIEENTIRFANTIGLEIGSEWGIRGTEEWAELPPEVVPGNHIVRNNVISDNGLCGIAGLGHFNVRILNNVLERNNRLAFRTWEVGAIKFHYAYYSLIEGNLIRDTDGFGVWIDNTYYKGRITRNVILNSQLAGVFIELGEGPFLVDNNIIAYTRHGDGVYAHDASGFTIAHNLIYSNAHYGVWTCVATDRRSRGGVASASRHRVYNNLIFNNGAGSISLPFPFERAEDNVSDGNLFMAGGAMIDGTPVTFRYNDNHGQVPARTVLSGLRDAAAGLEPGQCVDLTGLERRPELTLEEWRALTGNDRNSRITRIERDIVGTFALEVRMNFRKPSSREDFNVAREAGGWEVIDDLWQVGTVPLEGMDCDFLGHPFPEAGALPGPFQQVRKGPNRFLVWPVKAMEKGYPLKPGEEMEVPEYFRSDRGPGR
jgi:hypothetical protein